MTSYPDSHNTFVWYRST